MLCLSIKTEQQVKGLYTALRILDLSALSLVANSGSLGTVIFNLGRPVARSEVQFITFCGIHDKETSNKI
jgi:hypothetical protein